MTARFERTKERRSLFERCYVLTLEVLRDGHILRILIREMFIDKGLDVCEARTLRGPVAALPVNDFVVLAAASYADRLQLARLLHTQGEFIQRRLIQISARVIGAANDPIQLQKDDRCSGRSALRSGRDGFGRGRGGCRTLFRERCCGSSSGRLRGREGGFPRSGLLRLRHDDWTVFTVCLTC